jgi:excinuclease ABC subunit C
MPAAVARRTMSLAHKLFGIRSCNEVIDGNRPRPCLEYDIGRCLAPCVAAICSLDEYRRAAEQARLLIEGRQDELISGLSDEMREAAATERFERAAHLRDAITTIETLRDRHNKVESPAMGDRDAFGIKLGTAGAVVQVFQMRRGRVCDRIELVTEARDLPAGSETEVLTAALQQFYGERQAPPEVHIPAALDEDERGVIEAWLSSTAGRRVRLAQPQRGEKRGLVDLAARNAALAYQSHFGEGATTAYQALETLREVLHVPTLPRRIECFDISTFQGAETVASMVVCEDGRMKRGEYRKYRVRGSGLGARDWKRRTSVPIPGLESPVPSLQPPVPDDFAAMHEVVQRRYRKLLEEGGPFPDLILIDGGKGQLSAAYAALEELGLANLVAVGIAKKEELLFTRDREDPIGLAGDDPALLLLQRIRDEAHRFAVTYHRQRRDADLRRSSVFDELPQVGPVRRRRILEHFGSPERFLSASRDEMERVPGLPRKVAREIYAHLHKTG